MSFRLAFDQKHSYEHDRDQWIQVPVRLFVNDRSLLVTATLDTGSEFCVFERKCGELLGLDVEAGPTINFQTMAGRFPAHEHTVTLETCGISFECTVYFAQDYGVKRSFLGRNGWLDHFRLAIVHYDRELFLSPYQS